MTKVIGQQQFSQLWSQFQTTNSHLFQDGGQLKPSISTDDVQQLLTTVTQDRSDDAQLYGVHRLVTEHTDVFANDDLELFRMEIDGLDLDFSRFAEDVATSGFVNSAKRFANSARDKKEAFVIQSDPGHVWDLESEEGIIDAIRAIVQQDKERYPGDDVAQAVGSMSTSHKFMSQRYIVGDASIRFVNILGRLRNARGLKSRDVVSLPTSRIVIEIKERLGWVEPASTAFVMHAPDGYVWDLESEEGILAAIRAIVEQDKERYPDEHISIAVGAMSTSAGCKNQAYLFDNFSITLGSLLRRLRKVRGYVHGDKLAPGDAQLIGEIKVHLGWIAPESTVFEIRSPEGHVWDFATEEGIFEAIEAIVKQDKERYPGEDLAKAVGVMSNHRRFRSQRYNFNGVIKSLRTLYRLLRVARGLKRRDSKALRDSAITEEIKVRLGWVAPASTEFEVKASKGYPWDFESEEGVFAAIKAVVEQDKKRYPGHDPAAVVGVLSGSSRFLSRRYRFGDEIKSLRELFGCLRVARGLSRQDKKALSESEIVAEIKERLGWIEPETTAFTIRAPAEHVWDLVSEDGIFVAFKAIVEQDKERYPGKNLAKAVGALSTSEQFVQQRYSFNGNQVSLGTLLRRWRVARGLRGDDYKALSNPVIIAEIKARLGWVKPKSVAFEIHASKGHVWDLESEEGVFAAIRAIVEQDEERFPGDDLSVAVGALAVKKECILQSYRFSGHSITLGTLLRRLRRARGFGLKDNSAWPTPKIVAEIKTRFGWVEPERAFAVRASEGHVWDLVSEDGVFAVIRAIVEQDKDRYPGNDVKEAVGAMSTDRKFLAQKYSFGEDVVSLRQLFGRLRTSRGLKAHNGKTLRDWEVVAEIKERLGWVDSAFEVLAPEGHVWDFESENGILTAINTIVSQDDEHFPGETLAEKLSHLVAGQVIRRSYQFGNENYTIRRLIRCFRCIRGVDAKELSAAQCLLEFRKALGGLLYADEHDALGFAKRYKLDPVISLLSESPACLRDFLQIFFKEEIDADTSLHLVRTFSGLKLYTEIRRSSAPVNDLNSLVGAMLVRQDSLAHLSEREYERVLRLLQYVMGRHFESDYDATQHLVNVTAQSQDNHKMKDLLAALCSYYKAGRRYGVIGIATDLFLYQRLGVQYLVDNDSAILADDPGLGKTLQALAAAEKLREEGKVKKALIVAPARVKGEWESEIAEHLKDADQRKVVKIDGDARVKSQQVEDAADAEYIILNYEFLRGKTQEELASILKGLDLLIVDEAQKMSNPDDAIQQAEAVRNIEAPRKWLLTATPYYSHPEHIFSLLKYLNPDQYGSFKEFREAFATDSMGLRLLHGELEGVMLRRSIAETLGVYEAGVPMEQQGVRMPRRDVVPPEEEGHYDLTRGQVELLRELSQDIRGWMVRRGYSKKMAHFTHLKFLYHATVDPALLGEDVDTSMYNELDSVVMKRLAQGKKVLIYAHHQEVVRRIRRRYEHLGAVQFNGDPALKDKQKETNLSAFETDPDTRLMVAGVESGGTGLNIKAADVIVNVERTLKHSSKIQSQGRPQRLSPENPKESYEVVTLVPRYPKELMESETDPEFRAFMSQGTVSEILEERLSDLDRVYHLVMGGLITEADAEKQSRKLLVQGFAGLQRVNVDDIDTPRRRKAFAAAGAFYQLWDRCRDDSAIQVRIRQLAALFHKTGVSPQGLVNVLADIEMLEEGDLDWLMAPFSESNNHLREAAVQLISPLVKSFVDFKRSLSDVADELASPSNRVARVVLPLMTLFRPWENEGLAEIIKKLLAEIESASSSIRGQAITSLMVMSTSLGQSGNGRFRDFILRHAHIFRDEDVSIMRRTSALERLALFHELSVVGYEEVVEGTYDDIDALSQALKESQWQTLANEFGLEWDDETEARIARLHGSWGDFRPLMGLLNGMQRFPDHYSDEIAQLKEIFVHAVRGDLHEWRNEQMGDREAGNKITYLENHPDFWRQWSQEDETRHDEVIVEAGIQRHILGEEYEHLVRLLQLAGDGTMQDIFAEFVRGNDISRQRLVKRIGADKKVLAKASRKSAVSADDVNVARRYGVGEDSADVIGTALGRVNRLFKMLRVVSSIVSWSHGRNDTDLNVREVISVLKQMALGLADSADETSKQLREQFDRMRHFLEASGKERKYKSIRVYDTDDPNIIMRLGALAPDMVNCFNHHGNPAQNHVLTGALGTRNFRVVVVEVDGRVRAAAPVKVRKADDEHPVIFLERGLFSGRYNFEREMLDHLERRKAHGMELQPLVARQVMKPTPGDITVYSTGSYSRNEYAEALFGVRESEAVYHSARVVFDPREPQQASTAE